MKKQFRAFLLALFGVVWLVLMASSCHKTPTPESNPEPDLPPATQEGKGTIGCYINGKPWVPKPFLCVACDNYLKVTYDASQSNLFVLSSNNYIKDSVDQYLRIYVYKPVIGNNKIPYFPEGILNGSVGRDINKNTVYYLDTTQINIVKLNKIDTEKKIISGEFQFTAISTKKDTIKVTSGRFDTKYY